MRSVQIHLDSRSYFISIGSAIGLDQALLATDMARNMAVVVTNAVVAPLHLPKVLAALGRTFRRVEVVELPDGEQFKTWDSLDRIYTA